MISIFWYSLAVLLLKVYVNLPACIFLSQSHTFHSITQDKCIYYNNVQENIGN
jgi:hypothetical protein